MNATDLKKYIIKHDKVISILDELKCGNPRPMGNTFRASLPTGDNDTAIAVYKDNLSTSIYTSEGTKHGDIYTLVMHILNVSFGSAIRYVHDILSLEYSYTPKADEPKHNPLSVFTQYIKCGKAEEGNLEIFDKSILDEYIMLPHITWYREGVLHHTAKRFNIGFSSKLNRIVIPHRLWCGDDNAYVGVVGRTVIPEYDMLGIPKFLHIKPYHKKYNLYGLNENYKHIQEAGYCVVYEAEKSVLLRHSVNDKTGVAVCGHTLSPYQKKVLIGLNVDIIIAYDNDISEDYVRQECKDISKSRNVYYIKNYNNIMDKKESPADLLPSEYQILFENKVLYQE